MDAKWRSGFRWAKGQSSETDVLQCWAVVRRLEHRPGAHQLLFRAHHRMTGYFGQELPLLRVCIEQR